MSVGPGGPCTEDDIRDAERRLGVTIPLALTALYRVTNGHFDVEGQWWVIWPLERLVDDSLRAWQDGLPTATLAFGDDGAGDPFCIALNSTSEEVVRWSWIAGEVTDRFSSLDDFVKEWSA